MDAEMDTVQFAAERNERLVDFDREMRLLVVQALQLYVDGDPDWIEPIVTGSAVLWLEIFAREAPDAYPDSVLRDFQALATRSLKKTVTPEDPPAQAQIDRVTNWIGTLTVNDATFHANRAVRGKTMTWITMRDEAVRPVHVATDGQNVSVNGTFDVGGYGLRYPGEPVGPPEIWMNCVIGSTQVEWPGQTVEASTRRGQSGPIVHLRTVKGHDLTVTPNHPILTPTGYVPAGELRPGDEVMATLQPVSPEVADAPPSIEQVHGAAREHGQVARVGGSVVDFHGDGAESEVEVVWSNIDLPLELRSEVSEPILVGAGLAAGTGVAGGTAEGASTEAISFGFDGSPSALGIGGQGVRPPLFGSELGHSDSVGLTPASGREAQLLDPSIDDNSAAADFPRHLEDALAVGMAACQIAEVNIESGSRHVYNLHTSANWYTANGIATHNCRCLIAPGKVKKAMTASLAVTEEVPPAEPPTDPEAEVPEEDDDLVDTPTETPWHAVLAPMGVKSGDDRMFALNALTWRNLPLPLTYQHQSTEGHGGSIVVGRIDEIWIENDMALARGVFQQTEEADKVIEGIAGGFIRGVSVDVDEVALQEEDMSMTVFTAARIAGATLVSIPAFQEAFVALGADFEAAADPALAASAGCNCQGDEFGDEQYEQFAPGTRDGPGWITNPVDTQRLRRYWTKGEGALKIKWGVPGDFNRCRIQLGKYVNPLFLAGTCANLHKEALGVWPGMESGRGRLGADVITASALHLVAAATAPVNGEWFQNPQLLGPTPLTVTDDGRIFGHVAAWGSCHIGLPGACTTPPKSYSKYAYYRTGVVSTTIGDIAVGQITMSTGHASIKANARAAAAHYDNTGSAVADVAAGEDSYGIWIAGAMRASASDEQRDQLRAGSLSGDWRTIGGSLEMVAALAVNVPGFPIPRTSLAASGDQQESLVASGVIEQAVVAGGGLSAEDVAAIVRTTIDEVAFRAERAGRLAKGLEAKASIKAKRIGFARARLTKGE